MERQEGYYWVKQFDKWWAAYFVDGRWLPTNFNGKIYEHADSYFQEINENRIPEPKAIASNELFSKIIRRILIVAEYGCIVAALHFYHIGNYTMAIFLMLWGILFEIRTNERD